MKILLILTVLLLIITYTKPEYQFKSTSPYITNKNIYYLTESSIYNKEYSNNNNKPGIRKVSGLDGWTFWILWGSYNGVPSNASNSDMYDYYDYILSGGTLSYNDWWNQKYSVPIGDIYPLLLISILYFYYNYRKNRLLGG